jgi:hypothetical protein
VYEFETPQPITATVRIRSGEAILTAEERDVTTVEVTPYDGSDSSREAAEQTHVELHGDTLVVEVPESGGSWLWRRGGAIRVVVRVPLDSAVNLKVASADGIVKGRWREGSVTSASGDLAVDEITGDLHANTASGDIDVGRVGGGLRINSASGDINVGSVGGDASLQSASGDIEVDDLGGSTNARTASGDIDLDHVRRGEVRAQTASGDVRVAVAPGTGVYLDVSTVSGSTSSELSVGSSPTSEKGADLGIYVRTVSGDVAIVRSHDSKAA